MMAKGTPAWVTPAGLQTVALVVGLLYRPRGHPPFEFYLSFELGPERLDLPSSLVSFQNHYRKRRKGGTTAIKPEMVQRNHLPVSETEEEDVFKLLPASGPGCSFHPSLKSAAPGSGPGEGAAISLSTIKGTSSQITAVTPSFFFTSSGAEIQRVKGIVGKETR